MTNRRNFLKSLTLGAAIAPIAKHFTCYSDDFTAKENQPYETVDLIHDIDTHKISTSLRNSTSVSVQEVQDLLPPGFYTCKCTNVTEKHFDNRDAVIIEWGILSVKEQHTITQYMSLNPANFTSVKQFCNNFKLIKPGSVMVDFNDVKGHLAKVEIVHRKFQYTDVTYSVIKSVEPIIFNKM
jgi:hypothetical protein